MQSNILIDDEGKAKLCDFGLSSIVVEFCGTSSLTSCVGGAVRWADALFYSINTDDEEQETPAPALTTRSDIYSFGSVTLEVRAPSSHVFSPNTLCLRRFCPAVSPTFTCVQVRELHSCIPNAVLTSFQTLRW